MSLLDLLLRVTGFSACSLLLVAVLGRKSAATRHSAVTVALLVLLSFPLLGALLPKVTVPVLPSSSEEVRVLYTPTQPIVAGETRSIENQAGDVSGRPFSVPQALWVAGLVILALRLVAGLFDLRRRIGQASVIDKSPRYVLVLDRTIRIAQTAWWGRHYIFVPSDWSTWSPERKEVVLLHEASHIRRRDWFVRLASQLAIVMYWPCPLVWWMSRIERQLAEEATDNAVLAHGIRPEQYADDLLQTAKLTQATGFDFAMPMATRSTVARRIEMILLQSVSRTESTPAARLALWLAGALIAVPLSSWGIGARQAGFTPPSTLHASPASAKRQYILSTRIFRSNEATPASAIVSAQDPARSSKLGKLLSAPMLRTQDGMKAKISVSGSSTDGSPSYDITLTPKATPKDSRVQVTWSLSIKLGAKNRLTDQGSRTIKGGEYVELGSQTIYSGEYIKIVSRIPGTKSDAYTTIIQLTSPADKP